MKTEIAAVTIARPLEEVHALLDDITAHERFLDHFLTDWEQISESPRGVGAAVRMKVKGGGRHDVVEARVIESAPRRITEESRGGKGFRRRARGTYELSDHDGGTRVVFHMELLDGSLADRLSWPIGRAIMGRGTQKGLERLKAQMEG